MPVSFDLQHTRAYLSTLSTESIAARLELLIALLEDLRTFPTIDSLERDISQWISAHHVLSAERDLTAQELESVVAYRFLRYLAFRTPLSDPIEPIACSGRPRTTALPRHPPSYVTGPTLE